jgi:SAM-dependent methyltransferase
VRYLGVDPDAERIALLAARHPWARFRVGRAEEPLADGPVDHVLALRSWNHFRDPASVVDRALAALRPGGSLLVVDNVAFGLLRSREHAGRAERGPGAFEHYRNDGAREAELRLAGRPLRIVERRDVGITTSNQWLLRWERLPDAMQPNAAENA